MKKEYVLKGLGCAHCAAKMERGINKIEGVKEAYIDFVSKKLRLEIDNPKNAVRIAKESADIVKSIESNVILVETKNLEHEVHSHDHSHEHEDRKSEIIKLAIALVLFAVPMLHKFQANIEVIFYFSSFIIAGSEVLLKALKNIIKGQIFDENFLMAIATIGAFSIRKFPEGAAVMLFYQIGELFQDMAVDSSRKSITELMNINPDFANLKMGTRIEKVSPYKVEIGDIIIVKPGEKIPLDGKVIEGESTLDTSALTGESIPKEVKGGDEVLSGVINRNGLLSIKVTRKFSDSAVSKILKLVEEASGKKAPTENFITKFARYYTPAVVIIAALLAVIPPLTMSGEAFSTWVYRALVFLVVSCPCALVISIPLSFFGGIGGASRKGILVKGGNYLEALNSVNTVVFDKTGTLTKGMFKVIDVNAEKNMSKEELLEYAAYAESCSNHPIAISILETFGKDINQNFIENYIEKPGHGIRATIKGKNVILGNYKIMEEEKISYSKLNVDYGTEVYVAIDGVFSGSILIADEIKKDAKAAIAELKGMGINKIVMLTGDSKSAAEKVSKELGINEVYYELLPNEKVEKLELLSKQKLANSNLIFVGDGINDAPVLAMADIGISMGFSGSDAAIEASDVVIMNDAPSKINTAIKIAKKTKSIVWQNIVIALGIKAIVLILGAVGIASMWEAVFADVGVALIAVLNAMRVFKN